MPISNALYLADYFIVRRFLKWQQQYMPCIEDWIEAVSHFDALISMATFRYNEPVGTDAEIIETDAIVYSAKGLYHPFLGEQAVRNDFQISDGHYYIITGANMAGKSTCFEIQLSDEITYTYRITEGVARNQNATYLLKNILEEQT